MIAALNGYVVMDLTTQLPGPYCSMLLADLGASVIKVEPPGGDPLRKFTSAFASVNRGKRDIVIDLKNKTGQEVMHRLMARADVVMEGFRPGVAERLGVDYASVSHFNPSVVYCSISGFGQDGPYRNRAGHDINYLAIGGLLSQQKPPAVPPVLISDLSSGMYGALAIIAGLMDRQKTGTGCYIDLSMTDCILSWMALDIARTANAPVGDSPPFLENIPHYGIFETSDNRYISIGIVHEDHFWAHLCDALGLADWRDWSSEIRITHEAEIREKLRTVFSSGSCKEWDQRLSEADVPCGIIYNLDELKDVPYIKYRNPFYNIVASDETASRQVKSPFRTDQPDVREPLPPPVQGEHSRIILSESGYADNEIEDLIQQGVISEFPDEDK